MSQEKEILHSSDRIQRDEENGCGRKDILSRCESLARESGERDSVPNYLKSFCILLKRSLMVGEQNGNDHLFD